MSEITTHLIHCIEVALGCRDEGEQEELLVDMGCNMYLYDTEGVVSINDGKLIDYICENHIPLEGGSFLQAICNDIEWGTIELFLKTQVEDWFDRKLERQGEDEDFPDNRKTR